MKTASSIRAFKGQRKLTVLTCYDALTARILQEVSGLDILLVGDSLGNVVCGERSTVPVTLEHIIYHARMVRRGAAEMFLVADMPFMTYPYPEEQSLRNIQRVIQETGVESVKVEGASKEILRLIEKCSEMGCAVMGHVGVTPQQINKEGYRRKGKQPEEARQLIQQAKDLEKSGAFALVLECVQKEVAAEITDAIAIPTIGIGSGNQCDGQVWVTPDLLGLVAEPPPFMKPLVDLRLEIQRVVKQYVAQVQSDQLYSG